MLCTMCSLQCLMSSLQFTMCSVQFSAYSVHCAMSYFCVQCWDGSVQWARLRLCVHCAILSFWCSVYSVCAVFNNFVFGGMLIAWPLQRTWENLKDSIYSVKFFLCLCANVKAFVIPKCSLKCLFPVYSLQGAVFSFQLTVYIVQCHVFVCNFRMAVFSGQG